MAFSINEMLAVISSNGGISKASKFIVRMHPPPAVGDSNQDLLFFCESAQLPGISFGTDDVKMSGFGNVEKRPHSANFTDMPMSFFSDTDGNILRFFHKWIQSVYNFNNFDNPYGVSQNLGVNVFAYPKEYRSTIEILHLEDKSDGYTNLAGAESTGPASKPDVDSQIIVNYTLYDAFPISIGDVSLNWGSSDELIRIPVTFAYTNWTSTTMAPNISTDISQARASTLDSTQSRVDATLSKATELLYVQPAELQQQTNYYSQYLNYF
jgi:hypothetical protein